MLEQLGRAATRGGQTVEIVLVTAPEVPDALDVRHLLGHKGGVWEQHIDQALAGALEGLETRFYVALVAGAAVANVMTVEYAGVGILGHVYTVPEQRRQGLCDALFAELQPHFIARGGRRLLLGTGYDKPPYHIYWRHGWRPVIEGTGFMDWQPAPPATLAGPWRVVPYAWRHWPALAAMFADDHGDGLQALGLRIFGPENFEWAGLDLRCRCTQDDDVTALVAETADGVAGALALLSPDRSWRGVTNLDLIGVPAAAEAYADLLAAVPRLAAQPRLAGKLQCWLPSGAGARRAALEAAGFGLEATLRGQLPDGGDAVVYSA